MGFCTNCGSTLGQDAPGCPSCGYAVIDGVAIPAHTPVDTAPTSMPPMAAGAPPAKMSASVWNSKIGTESDAVGMLRYGASWFFWLAVVRIVLGLIAAFLIEDAGVALFIGVLVEAGLFALLGLLTARFRTRVGGVILSVLAAVNLAFVVYQMATSGDAAYIAVSLNVFNLYLAGRMTEATLRLHKGFAAEPLMATAGTPVAAWHPDPTGRNKLRYWDGGAWTANVSTDGVQAVDPL